MRVELIKITQIDEVCWDLWFMLEMLSRTIEEDSVTKKDSENCLFYCSEELGKINERIKKI